MLIATVAASPVLGGKVAGLDDQKAKAVPGVRQIVPLDDAVAVVADHNAELAKVTAQGDRAAAAA
jgi:isoquinoline 1-oxidoreductase subunit beta